ncbi:MAG: hypothetical protein HYW90_04820 [Candidatus Sungbacteria bacterium]|nr:hypothetical protein [Parcubacteria group bacterium]MBI2640177.1 hypothetical protein [Candidatus Sungbacteria bacterium]
MSEKSGKAKSAYPHIRISRKSHDFLKKECLELGTPSITEFIELLLETYKENKECFGELTGGVIGEPKPNLFDYGYRPNTHK